MFQTITLFTQSHDSEVPRVLVCALSELPELTKKMFPIIINHQAIVNFSLQVKGGEGGS